MEIGTSLFERIGSRPALLRLLGHFYADVRQHRVIGPIFANQIENWTMHIEKIADFWTRLTGGPAIYTGAMPTRHIPLGLREEHFQAWLGLWDVNCRLWLSHDGADELSALARQIGVRLRQFCGVSPSLRFALEPLEHPPTSILKL
jgi:hemoglobin